MIPAVESNTNLNTAIFLIASLSPSAKDSIDQELYKQTSDSDGATDQYILEDAFLNMIHDLETIGVILNMDYTTIVSDMGPLFGFIQFASYLLPNSLYDMMKTNAHVRDCIGHILSGTAGEEETLIQTYLSQIGGLDGQLPLADDLIPLVENYYPLVSQSAIFTDYMKNLYDLLLHERLSLESDPESHTTYRNHIRSLIGRLSDAVNSFSHNPRYDQICKIQDQVIQDLVAPVNFLDYNYLLTVDKNTLPTDLHASYDQKWYHYRVSHSWCPDYFQIRKQTPLPVHLILMYSFLYACHPDPATYDAEAKILRMIYPSPETESMIQVLYKQG